MPEHYWPSAYAEVLILPSAHKWGVSESDIHYVLSLNPHRLLVFDFGQRHPHLDWYHGGRSTRVQAVTMDGYLVELVLRRDGSSEHERCLVFHACYL